MLRTILILSGFTVFALAFVTNGIVEIVSPARALSLKKWFAGRRASPEHLRKLEQVGPREWIVLGAWKVLIGSIFLYTLVRNFYNLYVGHR